MKHSRKPDELTAKRLTEFGDSETLWFNDSIANSKSWGVITHDPGDDFLVIELADDDDKRVRIFLRRPLIKKLLPFLAAFADGGDFGISGEQIL